jgi:hypothetical protein
LKTTENYLASFEKEERVKNAAFLTNFGMNNLKTTCILENILQNRDDNGKYFAVLQKTTTHFGRNLAPLQ